MTKELIACGRCQGTGTRDRDGRDPKCTVCGGVGQIFFPIPYTVCGRCKGDGTRDQDGRDPVCPVCHGAGVVFWGSIREF